MSKIGVLMSVKNGERFLEEAIQSILDQTIEDFKFFIFDDRSKDKSISIIENFSKSDDRICFYQHDHGTAEENLGISKSLNFLLKKVEQGIQYININDQDDVSHPEKLEKTLKFMEQNQDYGLAGTVYSIIDENSNVIRKLNMLTSDEDIRRDFYFQNWFGHGSILFRKSVLVEVGYYDPVFDQAQDYELIMRVMEVSKVANIPEYLWFWRSWKNNSGKIDYQLKLLELARYKAYCRKIGIEFNPDNFREVV